MRLGEGPMPVNRLLKVSTTVADLSAAVVFYRDWLGLACGAERAVDDQAWKRLLDLEATVAARAVSVFVGEQELELIAVEPPGRPYPPERASNDQWFQHVALVTIDIAFVWDRLRAGSPGKITDGGPQLLPPNTGGVTALKFRDPEGHPLELISFPPGIRPPMWHGDNGKGIIGYDHTAISVADVDRSIAFYTDLLGFRVGGRSLNRGIEQDRLDGLVGCEVDVVALEPAAVETPHLELLHYRAPAGRTLTSEVRADDAASTRQIHKVDDLDALVRQLEGKARFVSPGIVTLKSGERAAAIRDPDGHMIVLMGD
jgi:catechol 2,3-dioxygenase-like lactoylglutathione lyase family enzyme